MEFTIDDLEARLKEVEEKLNSALARICALEGTKSLTCPLPTEQQSPQIAPPTEVQSSMLSPPEVVPPIPVSFTRHQYEDFDLLDNNIPELPHPITPRVRVPMASPNNNQFLIPDCASAVQFSTPQYQCKPSNKTPLQPTELTKKYYNQATKYRNSSESPTSVPSCFPVEGKKKNASLSSIEICKENLIPYKDVMKMNPTLQKENVIGKLAIKLAVQSFFGENVMRKCTVLGCREFPALPLIELNNLKQALFTHFPAYYNNPIEFEDKIWNSCVTSIGQKCKRLRNGQVDKV